MMDFKQGTNDSMDDENQKHITNEELSKMDNSNILVASWINNLGYANKPLENKFFFFNSEKLLNNGEILEHFNPNN